MKKLLYLVTVIGIALSISGCCSKGSCPMRKCPKAQAEKLCQQHNIFLPQVIYAVPGVECNIYFKNIFLAVNHDNFVFDVSCKIGSQQLKKWFFTPQDKDANKSYPLTIKVFDQNENLVAQAQTVIKIAPADAGKGKKVSILMIGDSLTNATVYPAQLHKLCQGQNNPALKMVGSHAGGGKKVLANGVAHEGYGGWKWETFLTKYAKTINPKARYRYAARSKFLFPQADGTLKFSVQEYLKKYNNSEKPDIVTFQLGVNDVFWASKENIDEFCSRILANADKLIAAMRKELPDALFGVGFVTAGANQDAFGVNYKCGQTAWSYQRNSLRLNQAMAKHFAVKYKDAKLVMIPVNVNLDTENNFPARKKPLNAQNETEALMQHNGVHPAASGYRQMGDSYYAWLKNMLAAQTAVKPSAE